MNVNPTLALTVVLLSLMVGAGIFSGSWGYNLGRDALQGITQPDTKPGTSTSPTEPLAPRRAEVPLLNEAEILAEVEARMQGNPSEPVAAPAEESAQDKAQTPEPTTEVSDSFITYAASQAQLPVISQSEGVIFQVLAVQYEADALVLQVSLENQSDRPHQFLYSFMTITDEQGQNFDGSTQGLPGELRPASGPFYGTVSIPIALLDNAQTLSLALTDYPEEQVRLQMSNIPVSR